MNDAQQTIRDARQRRAMPVPVACLLLLVLGTAAAVILLRSRESPSVRSDTDVPLGVEQAVIIRSSGPRLKARPYRRGASINLRIANQVQDGRTRVYDIRYVVSLPGEFDLTDYLTSTDGRPIDGLPPFPVRGLTSLTKDIETRIQEIEKVDVRIWHWYHESLVGLGVLWVAWLMGLIFIGRPRSVRKTAPEPVQPSIGEQIERYLNALLQGGLTTSEKARLEALLLQQWRIRLGLADRRMAASCRDIEETRELGRVYRQLQAWLHNPRSGVGSTEFVEAYRRSDGDRRSHIAECVAS